MHGSRVLLLFCGLSVAIRELAVVISAEDVPIARVQERSDFYLGIVQA